jgi:hypothetical protein
MYLPVSEKPNQRMKNGTVAIAGIALIACRLGSNNNFNLSDLNIEIPIKIPTITPNTNPINNLIEVHPICTNKFGLKSFTHENTSIKDGKYLSETLPTYFKKAQINIIKV